MPGRVRLHTVATIARVMTPSPTGCHRLAKPAWALTMMRQLAAAGGCTVFVTSMYARVIATASM